MKQTPGQCIQLYDVMMKKFHAMHSYILPESASFARLLGVFMLVTLGWVVSEFLTHASKFNMMPNGECQIISPDRSHIF